MSKKGRLIIISAPSGAGKSTVVKALRERLPDLYFSVSYTTRKSRGDEKDDVDYHFVTRELFRRMIKEDAFIEYADVHGELYGTAKTPLEDAVAIGLDVLLDIDVQGGTNIKAKYTDAVSIFLLPPDLEVLEQRLRGRGTDSEKTIEKRLKDANWEMTFKDRYDHQVMNENVEDAVKAILKIIGT